MQALTLFMIVVVTTFEFLSQGDRWGNWAILPGWAPYLAELLGAAALVYVVFAGTRNRFQFVRPAYWFVLGALVVMITCGVVVNEVGSGPVFAGIRNYLRAIPWFFVPAVFAYSESQIRTQLSLLFIIALIQLPLAVQQRVATAGRGIGAVTGDWTSGTLMLSGGLSIFLICGVCLAAAYLVRKRLTLWQFCTLAVLLLFPTTINETKGTLVLLPVGLLLAFVAAARPGRRLGYVLAGTVTLTLFVAVFVPIYDYLNKERAYAVPLAEYLNDPERLERYLAPRKKLDATGGAGKIDSIVKPLQDLSSDPLRFVFGYGIGNVSDSALGHGFVGRYYRAFAPYATETSLGLLILELGVAGVTLIGALMWLIYRDAWAVARREDDFISAFAAGWVGVSAVIALSLAYTAIVGLASLSFLFWYFAGLVAADRMRHVVTNVAPSGRQLPRST
jgi:hypothetical protein